MKWSEEETVRFVELYRESECLWNVASPLYKDKHLRQKAIEGLVVDMKKHGFGIQEAKQKIKNIRSTFNQEMLKVMKSAKSGAGSTDLYTPTLKWFALLEPIMKMVKGSNKTSNNLETEDGYGESEVNQDDTYDFDQPETTNNEAAASVSPNPGTKHTIDTSSWQGSTKIKPPKRKLQELSTAVKELRNVSTMLSLPQSTQSEEDEMEVFGTYVSKSLKKLSAHDSVCAQQEIQGILTKYRLSSIQPPSAASSPSLITDSMGSYNSNNIEYDVEAMDNGTGLLSLHILK